MRRNGNRDPGANGNGNEMSDWEWVEIGLGMIPW